MKDQIAKAKFQHKAVQQDCVTCHDPHASNYTMQIRQPPLQLCTSCHEHDKIKQAAMNSKHQHDVVTKDNACLNCHTAHGGDLAKLMKAEQVKVCLKCHADPIDRGKGVKPVASVKEVLDPKLYKHGPAADGTCGGCHAVHGSDVSRLLKKDYPEVFYQGFALDKYDLCFGCHDKQLVLSEKTTGLTNFRNGDTNLHFLHVNKSDRGRSCRACHAVHASANPMHIRDSVPYGSWNMPINYKRGEDGGTCTPGCHKSFTYDRKTPVNYEEPAPVSPTTSPAQPAAPATQPALADRKDHPQ
jgi:predicted CXXCH cytochrome family protein